MRQIFPPVRPPKPEEAEQLAVAALGFLAADPERLQRFLGLAGIDVVNLRQAAAEKGFLAGVMAHIAGDERLLIDFAAEAGRRPEEIGAACWILNPEFEN